jgi:twitching motility protein PilT
MDFNALLKNAVDLGTTDIHLKVDRPPMLRIDGHLAPMDGWPDLDEETLMTFVRQVTAIAPHKLQGYEDTGELDVAYTHEGLPRFRCNVFRQRGNTSFALRVIPRKVPRFQDLALPPGVQSLAEERRGMVLVTGATGSGKTTTLAAMLGYVNETRHEHIITLEDPIEVLHPDVNCIVSQREIGLDTKNFGEALRRALRQDPDVILIGELRDAETTQTALQAAESGHMVFSTLHTVDAAETVGRLLEFFPPEKQAQIRSILAGVLRGVISQRLIPRVDGGRIAAVEVMVNNARIADLIREGKAEEVTDAVAEGAFFKMQTFTQSLIDLVLRGEIDPEVAGNAASNKHDFEIQLERAKRQQNVDVQAAEEAAKPPEDDIPALRIAGS